MNEDMYIIDSSRELLESTPETYESAFMAYKKLSYSIADVFERNPYVDTQEIIKTIEKDMDALRNEVFTQAENQIILLKSFTQIPYQYYSFNEHISSNMIDAFLDQIFPAEQNPLGIIKPQKCMDIYNEEDLFHRNLNPDQT